MMDPKPKLTEDERKALLERWENTPSENPRYRGLTPAQVARALRRPPKSSPLNDEE